MAFLMPPVQGSPVLDLQPPKCLLSLQAKERGRAGSQAAAAPEPLTQCDIVAFADLLPVARQLTVVQSSLVRGVSGPYQISLPFSPASPCYQARKMTQFH